MLAPKCFRGGSFSASKNDSGELARASNQSNVNRIMVKDVVADQTNTGFFKLS